MAFRMFSPPRQVPPNAAEPAGTELTLASALDRATERHDLGWRDRAAEVRELGLRIDAVLDVISTANAEDLPDTLRVARRWLRGVGDRVAVRTQRPFVVGDGEVPAGSVVWLRRGHAHQLVGMAWAEPA